MKLFVIDFEATCWRDREYQRERKQEIIEFGLAVVDTIHLNIIQKLALLVRPVFEPLLDPFCTELTTITQDMVDEGMPFADANRIIRIMAKTEDIFVSWGGFDRSIWQKNCKFWNQAYPFPNRHVNAKKLYSDITGEPECGLKTALQRMGLPFYGTAHRGGDDAINVANLIKALQDKLDRDGSEIQVVNEIKKMVQ